jgi:DNA-binding CsgD family transcriptional regulator
MDPSRSQAIFGMDSPVENTADVSAYLLGWTEKSQVAMALLSPDLKLVWCNASANIFFFKGQHVTLRDGALYCVDQSKAVALRAFLRGAGEERTSWVSTADDASPMIICARLLSMGAEPPLIGLTLFSTDPADRYVWTEFGEAFHLTKAEAAVVKRILDGANADEIADDQGISVETVRTHIRRLYGKLNISGREQLFALMAPFRIG